jgi:hypothetical protein
MLDMKRLLLTKLLLVVTLAASGQGTLKEFIEKNIYVIEVEQKLDIVTVHGYSEGSTSIEEFKIKLKRNQVFAIWNRAGHPLISLVTIPFKVRPGIGTALQIVTTGLSNAGISLSLYNKKLDRYFSGGKKSSHTFGVGVILSPTGEDLKSSNTNGVVVADIKHCLFRLQLDLHTLIMI